MEAAAWTPAGRWVFALKPASWPKLLVPMLLGLSIGFAGPGDVSLGAVVLVVLFTVAFAVFIVLLNDVADEPVDRIKREVYPAAGSMKTLVDGVLGRESLVIGATLAGTYAVATSVAGAFVLERPALVPLALLCIALFVAYSLPPVRLNYRGGGEALEAIGVGAVLPSYAIYAVAGDLASPAVLLSGFSALALGSAVSSDLSDERSDRRGGKRTVASLFGNAAARRATEGALGLGVLLWGIGTLRSPGAPWPPVVVAMLVVAGHLVNVRRLSAAATFDNVAGLRAYKFAVNDAIRDGGLVLTVGLVVEHLVRTA